MLSNPVRDSFKGWNDAANRKQLLLACEDFAPDWIVWLDADEELLACDRGLLRPFLESTAKRNHAYGLEVLRLIGDYSHYDLAKLWVYRIVSFRAGYTLPTKQLHFEPVPLQIPRHAWQRTRLRIAHSAGMTAAKRRLRYRKYLEADSGHVWQSTYNNLLDPPGHVWKIKPLPPDKDLLIP